MKNCLLIDFENVQPKNLAVLHGHDFKVKVFVGANQTKVSVELAKALQVLGDSAEYIQISGNGRNALDFHIAYTQGELAASHANAFFCVVSKDTGFDPLIEYLRKKGIRVQRVREIADIPVLRGSRNKSPGEKTEVIVANLRSRGSGRPRKVRTLKNTINALFAKSLGDPELSGLVKALERQGSIAVDGENVTYHL